MCERLFIETKFQDGLGWFYMVIPFCDIVHSKGLFKNYLSTVVCYLNFHDLYSRKNDLKQLYNLESRLSKDLKLFESYRKFIKECLLLGHLKITTSLGKYFISHHAIIKRDGDASEIFNFLSNIR